MARRPTKSSLEDDGICAVCGEEMSYSQAVRSRRFYEGVIGARLCLCSRECAEAYDRGLEARMAKRRPE
jgi:hypothetical protein